MLLLDLFDGMPIDSQMTRYIRHDHVSDNSKTYCSKRLVYPRLGSAIPIFCRRVARGLLKHRSCLFTFLEREGVEPTNNSAEKGVRPAVQWRKICFGNQSSEGELLTARLPTVVRTCSLQGKNTFQYLVDSINAHRRGHRR